MCVRLLTSVRVRGLFPWPGAFTYYRKKLVKIFKTGIINADSNARCGEVLDAGKDGILVRCLDGAILIKELQLESKKRMPAQDFLIGNKITKGEVLG